MSAKEHQAAVIAAMGGSARGAYSPGELSDLATLPTSYNEVHVMERLSSGPRRTSLPAGTKQWRILVRSVAQRFGNAQEMRQRASVLHELKLTVAGEVFYVERSMSDDPIGPDDGWWSGTSEFSY